MNKKVLIITTIFIWIAGSLLFYVNNSKKNVNNEQFVKNPTIVNKEEINSIEVEKKDISKKIEKPDYEKHEKLAKKNNIKTMNKNISNKKESLNNESDSLSENIQNIFKINEKINITSEMIQNLDSKNSNNENNDHEDDPWNELRDRYTDEKISKKDKINQDKTNTPVNSNIDKHQKFIIKIPDKKKYKTLKKLAGIENNVRAVLSNFISQENLNFTFWKGDYTSKCTSELDTGDWETELLFLCEISYDIYVHTNNQKLNYRGNINESAANKNLALDWAMELFAEQLAQNIANNIQKKNR